MLKNSRVITKCVDIFAYSTSADEGQFLRKAPTGNKENLSCFEEKSECRQIREREGIIYIHFKQ